MYVILFGLNIYEVAEKCKISTSYISLIENAKRKPSAIILKQLALIYNLSFIDLCEKAGIINSSEINDIKKTDINPITSIPILDKNNILNNEFNPTLNVEYVNINPKLAKQGDFFAMKIEDNSMLDILWKNDIIAIKKQNFAENGNIVVAINNKNEIIIRMFKIYNDIIKLIPLNRKINFDTGEPLFEDLIFKINDKNIKIIGIVKQLIERNF